MSKVSILIVLYGGNTSIGAHGRSTFLSNILYMISEYAIIMNEIWCDVWIVNEVTSARCQGLYLINSVRGGWVCRRGSWRLAQRSCSGIWWRGSGYFGIVSQMAKGQNVCWRGGRGQHKAVLGIEVLYWRQRAFYEILCCIHYLLQGPAVWYSAAPIPDSDAAGQDTLNDPFVEYGNHGDKESFLSQYRMWGHC